MVDPELILKNARKNKKDSSEGESCIDAVDAFGSVAFFEYVYVDGKKLPIDEVFKPVVTYGDEEDEDTKEAENAEE